MVKIYLNSEDMSFSLLLPVTPPEINVTEGTEARKYETANNGNISLVGNNELTEVSFSSFFPSSEREYSLNNSAFGMDYVAQINRFRARRIPCRLIIVGMGFDKTMIIERFEYAATRGEDINYSLRMVEKR